MLSLVRVKKNASFRLKITLNYSIFCLIYLEDLDNPQQSHFFGKNQIWHIAHVHHDVIMADPAAVDASFLLQVFIYLFAPLLHTLKESDFQNFRLENGLKIWAALWEYRHPDVPAFTTPVRPRRYYSLVFKY